MEEAAVMPCGPAGLPILITAEEEAKYPEAVACLRSIMSSLGPRGESPELCAQLDLELQQVREHDLKLRTDTLFNSAVKEVLIEEQINGYKRFSQDFVQKVMDYISITEMQQKYKDGVSHILGLGSSAPNLNLSKEEKSELLDAVSAKITIKVSGKTNCKKQVEQAKAQLHSTLLSCREKADVLQKLSEEHKMLLQKLVHYNDKTEIEQMNLEIMKLKLEIDVYKKKIAEIRIAKELYGGIKGEALVKLASQKQEELQQARSHNRELRGRLALYTSLPAAQFEPMVLQNQALSKQIENAKWSVQKLEDS